MVYYVFVDILTIPLISASFSTHPEVRVYSQGMCMTYTLFLVNLTSSMTLGKVDHAI